MSSNDWTPTSWKTKPIAQDVVYEDQERFNKVINKLNRLPPLVSATEVKRAVSTLWFISNYLLFLQIENLKSQLKEAALGNMFLLQGGDCAELFDYCSQASRCF